jgi:cytochrome d ubiquinol oxidase subunit II
MKTDGHVEARSRRLATVLLYVTLGFIAIVSIWTPLAFPRVAERWFTMPQFLYLSQVPLATLLVTLGCWYGLRRGKPAQPFVCAVLLFLLAYIGLVLSNVPYIVPDRLTVWDAAAAPESQSFMLVGVLILLPIILGYTVFNYWVFRGKVRAGEGYH